MDEGPNNVFLFLTVPLPQTEIVNVVGGIVNRLILTGDKRPPSNPRYFLRCSLD